VCESAVIDDPCRTCKISITLTQKLNLSAFIDAVKSNYSISTDKKTWGEARAACKKLGMDLTSLETVKEFQCVRDRIELAGKLI